MKIIKNRNIIFLWIGHLVSHAGDAVYAIALPWLIFEMTDSKIQTALVTTSAYLPALIFGLFSGIIVDRYSRKGIMICSDIIRFLLVMIIPLAMIFDFFSLLLAGIITFLIATCATLFYPARDCLIPQIVTYEELPVANSSMVISGQISHLLGPLFAGLGMSFFGLAHLFTADAISFLISIIMISVIIVPKKEMLNNKPILQLDDLIDVFRFLNQNKGLWVLLALTFINNIFIMGPASVGLVVFVKEILREDFIIFSYLNIFMASGMILGSFVFWVMMKYYKLVHILLIGILIDGMTFSLLYYVNGNFIAILILLFHGIGIPLIIVARTTIIQTIVPDHLRGRFFSIIHMAVMGTTSISIGLTGLILEFIGVDTLFLCIGICASLCIFVGLLSKNFLCLIKSSN